MKNSSTCFIVLNITKTGRLLFDISNISSSNIVYKSKGSDGLSR